MKNKKSKAFQVRLTEYQHTKLHSYAKYLGVTATEVIRDFIDEHIPDLEKDEGYKSTTQALRARQLFEGFGLLRPPGD